MYSIYMCSHALLRIPFHPAPGNLLVEIVFQVGLTLLKSFFMHLATQCCFSKASVNALGHSVPDRDRRLGEIWKVMLRCL